MLNRAEWQDRHQHHRDEETGLNWRSRHALQEESETGNGSGHTGKGLLGSTGSNDGGVLLRLLGLLAGASLGRGSGVLRLGSNRVLRLRSRVLRLGLGSNRVLRLGGNGVLGLGSNRVCGLGSRLVSVDGVDRLDRVLRDDNNWGLADGLGVRSRDGVDGRVNGLTLAVRALLVGVAIVLAVIEVPSVFVDIADELASVVDRVVLVTLTLVAVADNALVALLLLVRGVVALSAVADLELVPCVVVALLRSAETIVADNLPLGACRAVNLRSTVVTVADDDDVGGDDGDELGDGGSGSGAVLGEGDGGSGGLDGEGLGDEVGVDDSLSLTRVHADGDVNGEKDVDSDLSTHESIAGEATTVLSIVARADNVTLVSANSRRGAEVELATTVASVVVETEEVGAQASITTLLRVVLLIGVSLSEAREAVLGGKAAEEVEAVRVSNATSGGGGLTSSTSGSSASLSVSGSTGLDSSGSGVGECHGVELSRGQVAHGQGEDL
ncbi:hypothetical protein QX201_004567 [Fusarium graminearum]